MTELNIVKWYFTGILHGAQKIMITHQTIELWHGVFVARVRDIPDFDAALAPRVHVFGGVAHSDRTDNLPVMQSVDGPSMSGNARPQQSVGGEMDGLQLAFIDVETVSPATMYNNALKLARGSLE